MGLLQNELCAIDGDRTELSNAGEEALQKTPRAYQQLAKRPWPGVPLSAPLIPPLGPAPAISGVEFPPEPQPSQRL